MPLEIDNNNSNTTKTHIHKACSFGYKVVCKLDDKLSVPYKTYRGEDCIEKLYESLFMECERIIKCNNNNYYRNINDMIITAKEEKAYNTTKRCYMCKSYYKSYLQKRKIKLKIIVM